MRKNKITLAALGFMAFALMGTTQSVMAMMPADQNNPAKAVFGKEATKKVTDFFLNPYYDKNSDPVKFINGILGDTAETFENDAEFRNSSAGLGKIFSNARQKLNQNINTFNEVFKKIEEDKKAANNLLSQREAEFHRAMELEQNTESLKQLYQKEIFNQDTLKAVTVSLTEQTDILGKNLEKINNQTSEVKAQIEEINTMIEKIQSDPNKDDLKKAAQIETLKKKLKTREEKILELKDIEEETKKRLNKRLEAIDDAQEKLVKTEALMNSLDKNKKLFKENKKQIKDSWKKIEQFNEELNKVKSTFDANFQDEFKIIDGIRTLSQENKSEIKNFSDETSQLVKDVDQAVLLALNLAKKSNTFGMTENDYLIPVIELMSEGGAFSDDLDFEKSKEKMIKDILQPISNSMKGIFDKAIKASIEGLENVRFPEEIDPLFRTEYEVPFESAPEMRTDPSMVEERPNLTGKPPAPQAHQARLDSSSDDDQ